MSEPTFHRDAAVSEKEFQEISKLQATIDSGRSSLMEKQIAQAQLDDLMRSKEPPSHNHKHNSMSYAEGNSGSSNIFHDDEAFEKYNMGADGGHHPGSKVANQAMADRTSVQNNHKARGTQKERKAQISDEPISLPEH